MASPVLVVEGVQKSVRWGGREVVEQIFGERGHNKQVARGSRTSLRLSGGCGPDMLAAQIKHDSLMFVRDGPRVIPGRQACSGRKENYANRQTPSQPLAD